MSKVELFDLESGKSVDEIDIPDDVIVAAQKVSAWLKGQLDGVVLYNLTLADH